ncbi:fatty acid-binding protein 1, liver-like isoform X1 [Petromyzon marinus]|uniref:fatty acid-binding protein 1, liver-like isoform X1 n=1 Tax=Petromyzon marinus TaxID=7757 RepID=UPI003F729569
MAMFRRAAAAGSSLAPSLMRVQSSRIKRPRATENEETLEENLVNVMAAFIGKWELESQENFAEFMRLSGVPEDAIQNGEKLVSHTEITKSGDAFTISNINPKKTLVNTITPGKESDFETLSGKKGKVLVTLQGDTKMVAQLPNLTHTLEIVGGKLVETLDAGSVVFKRVSKKV